MTYFRCARCGGSVGNGGIDQAVHITALGDDAQAHTFFLCLVKDDKHERCASRVLTKAALTHATKGEGLALHQPGGH